MDKLLTIILNLFIVCSICSVSLGNTFKQSSNDLIPCEDDSDCEEYIGASCTNNHCQCNGTNPCEEKIQTLHIQVTKLGETCHTKADCNIEHSDCHKNKCQCQSGWVGTINGKKCLKAADGLGSTCEEGIQCHTKVAHSVCQNEKCACEQDTHEYNGECYKNIGLGQKCNQTGECTSIQHAKCTEETCTCKDGFVPNTNSSRCLQIAQRINAPCYEDIQCIAKFGKAICKQGFCQCEELFQYKKTRDICMMDLLLDETCENHTDCHGIEEGESRLECILGVCKCKTGYEKKKGLCIISGASLVLGVSRFMLAISLLFVLL